MSGLLLNAKDGLNQGERRIAALFPESFRIEDKSSVELLKYMFDLAAELNYYNFENEIEGDWRSFFLANPNLLITLTSHLDFSENLTRFEHIETQLQLSVSDDELFVHIQSLFDFLAEAVNSLKQLSRQFATIPVTDHIVRRFVIQIAGFEDIFSRYQSAHKQFKTEFEGRLADIPMIDQLPDPPSFEYVLFDKDNLSVREKIVAALTYLKKLFNEMRIRYNTFLGELNFYLKSYDLFADRQQPHLAIILTFIKLHKHLQEEVNALPKKHLDLYYRDILGFKERAAEPDSVHIFFELDRLRHSVKLNAGQELLAGSFENKPILFTLDRSLTVTPAKVERLRSLYVARQRLSPLAETDETTIYQAERGLVNPDDIGKNDYSFTSWYAMGEDQNRMGITERSMTQAQLSTLIASPVLYLPEGERKITLCIYLSNTSARVIDDYIQHFQQLNPYTNLNQIVYNLFNNAFLLSYTAETGWVSFKKFAVIYKKAAADTFLELTTEMGNQEPAITLYSPEVHGYIKGIDKPAVRIAINNDSGVNPYSFLRHASVQRVSIKVQVNGFSSLKLFNNLGALSAVAAFQPFGPSPLPGSALMIKNTNVFNKYTTAVAVNLDWIGLPDLSGGFAAYYDAYPLNIKNESFKVKFSSVNGGKSSPDDSERQELNLYQINHDTEGQEILQKVTMLNNILFQPLEYANNPLMDAENSQENAALTKDGTLKLELSSPAEGFGGRVYPQLVSETVMHNSRRLTAKRALPNPPYIPTIKSIQVSYVLEITESLSDALNYHSDASSMQMVHIHPFGFENTYPANKGGEHNLFTPVEDNRNLYIGLSSVTAGQELSLVFYLEENITVDSISDDTVIHWSYLDQNRWIPFSAARTLEDSTSHLISTGIIRLRLPNELCLENTILEPGLFWIRASTTDNRDVHAKIIAVYTNAVTATRQLTPEQKNRDTVLPAKTITDFKSRVLGIKKVWQPFSSSNGVAAESVDDFYVRISELLNHKSRPVTVNQIEAFILQHFPGIAVVKCITRNDTLILQDALPGVTLKVMVIPAIHEGQQLNTDQPRASIAVLFRVHKLLKEAMPSFFNIKVTNPVYEQVKFVFTVTFAPYKNFSEQALLSQLIDDIKAFICPWLNGNETQTKVVTKIFTAHVLGYIRDLSYILQASQFSMVHFFKTSNPLTGEEHHGLHDLALTGAAYVEASVPEAILIPADQHLITIVEDTSYQTPRHVGIGDLSIGTEFLVLDESEELKSPTPIAASQPKNEVFNWTITNL
ncbi:hypothetical protein HH214_10185 [Mucilaginibacter robiniae]|uniref:Baseplate protein J-like domain-containing protein n=1 Tax=Mucilaginibacter robiniae TaxID=2728022 RepID=A0A7L5E126_9SPHI|nr:baseplate J/gp47 family protein [Mucilaginibacter robiniae]QJD96208.1 hypothetical protein HH214_10185 [Mucilaginibacter robiniae]